MRQPVSILHPQLVPHLLETIRCLPWLLTLRCRIEPTLHRFLGHEIKTGDGLTVDCKALLTAAEVETLKKFNGSRGMLLQTWALKVAGTAYENIGVTRAFNPIRDDVHAIRQAGAGILNTLNLPVPFAYYHMLVVITAFNYALFAFAYLHMDSFLSPVRSAWTQTRPPSTMLQISPFGHDPRLHPQSPSRCSCIDPPAPLTFFFGRCACSSP